MMYCPHGPESKSFLPTRNDLYMSVHCSDCDQNVAVVRKMEGDISKYHECVVEMQVTQGEIA